MSSTINKRFAEAMRRLQSEDPQTYEAIKAHQKKAANESAKWRLLAQGKIREPSKESVDEDRGTS